MREVKVCDGTGSKRVCLTFIPYLGLGVHAYHGACAEV